MPNLLAHSLVVKRLYNKFSEKDPKQSNNCFLNGNYDFLVLGSFGPDPLFYTGLLIKNGFHPFVALKKIGNKLHKTDAKAYFRLLIQETYAIENLLEKNRFESFVFGQFAHYILDRETHPYILYESGFDSKGHISSHYHFDHAYFESNIDCALAKRYSINQFLSSPYETIPVNESNLRMLDRHIVPVLSHLFSQKHLPKKMYSDAVKNMKSLLRTMNHNGKWKAKLLGKSNSLSAMYQPVDPDFSVLNEERRKWIDPTTGTVHNESFQEMYDRAYRIIEDCYQDILKLGFNYETFIKYINGMDYYGAIPGSERKYKRTVDNK